jgi:hypothetical protein
MCGARRMKEAKGMNADLTGVIERADSASQKRSWR